MKNRISKRQLRRLASKYRLGPSVTTTSIWAPMPQASANPQDENLDREIDDITRTVEANNIITRRALADRLDADFWGPGRFRRALRAAIEQGRVRQMDGVLYAPRLDHPATQQTAAQQSAPQQQPTQQPQVASAGR